MTVTGEPGATSGKVSFRAAAFMADGKILPGSGEGTWEMVGNTNGASEASTDGRTFASEGDLELATQTLSGTFSEGN